MFYKLLHNLCILKLLRSIITYLHTLFTVTAATSVQSLKICIGVQQKGDLEPISAIKFV